MLLLLLLSPAPLLLPLPLLLSKRALHQVIPILSLAHSLLCCSLDSSITFQSSTGFSTHLLDANQRESKREEQKCWLHRIGIARNQFRLGTFRELPQLFASASLSRSLALSPPSASTPSLPVPLRSLLGAPAKRVEVLAATTTMTTSNVWRQLPQANSIQRLRETKPPKPRP